MSVHWPDEQPGSELASRRETLDFSTDRDVTDIRIVYSEEQAYDGAEFVGRFTGSIREPGNVYRIRRNGGWNRDFSVYIDEEPEPPPTGGQPWGAVYSVDLTAMPTMTLANGANTIDGYEWYSKGTAGFVDAVVNNVLNGSGMECGSAAFGVTGDYSFRTPWFPFAQLANYNPAAPVAVAWRWSGASLSSSNYMVGGLASMADNGTQWLSAERASQALVKYEGASNQLIHYTADGAGLSVAAITPTSTTTGDHVFVEMRGASAVFSSAHQAWTGSLPTDVWALTSGLNPRAFNTARPNLGFFFTRNRTTAFTCYLTHLAVLQPRVAT